MSGIGQPGTLRTDVVSTALCSDPHPNGTTELDRISHWTRPECATSLNPCGPQRQARGDGRGVIGKSESDSLVFRVPVGVRPADLSQHKRDDIKLLEMNDGRCYMNTVDS